MPGLNFSSLNRQKSGPHGSFINPFFSRVFLSPTLPPAGPPPVNTSDLGLTRNTTIETSSVHSQTPRPSTNPGPRRTSAPYPITSTPDVWPLPSLLSVIAKARPTTTTPCVTILNPAPLCLHPGKPLLLGAYHTVKLRPQASAGPGSADNLPHGLHS